MLQIGMLKRQTRRKFQHAGKFIYAGSSGCAFGKPPLKCKAEATRRNSKYVSKLMNMNTARNEKQFGEKFKRINAAQKYFVSTLNSCAFNRTNVQPSNQLHKCYDEAGYNTLLFSENGGDNLWILKLQPNEYIPFFESLTNLFDGLELMRSYNIAHCDIKPGNIVAMKQSDGSFLTRFIDYGISLENTNTIRPLSYALDIFDANYVYWPYEIHLYHPSFKLKGTKKDDIHNWYEKTYDQAISFMPQNAYYTKNTMTSADYRITSDVFDTILRLRDTDIKKNSMAEPLARLDMYSLGITLAKVYKRFIRQQQVFADDGSLAITGVPLDKGQLTAWSTEVAETITKPFSFLIEYMTIMLPSFRYLPLQAKAKYETILPQMRKLFTKENIERFIPQLERQPEGFIEAPLSPTNLSRIQITPDSIAPLPKPKKVFRLIRRPTINSTLKMNNVLTSNTTKSKPTWKLVRNASGKPLGASKGTLHTNT